MFLEWDESYEVGIKKIDNQHRMLFRLTNELHEARGRETDRQATDALLAELVNYVEYHFKSEEDYFRDHPEAEDHHRVHADFVYKVADFNKQFLQGECDLDNVIFNFLRNTNFIRKWK